MGKQIIRLTESDLHRIVKESVNKILREGWDYNLGLLESDTETEDEKRKRQMNDDWRDIERHMEYYNSSHPGDSKYSQSSLGDAFASSWAGAGKKPGALAMDAQLPYEHPFTTQRGGLYKKADTSKWSEPSMKGRGYEGQNAARNFARNIRFKKDSVAGMTPYPWDTPEGYPTGRIYGDIDKNNIDDQDYFEDKIKSTDERWYKNQKDHYKRMKKLAQLVGGKRSEKDDERAFKRALKAADERPLHRKGSLNRAFDK